MKLHVSEGRCQRWAGCTVLRTTSQSCKDGVLLTVRQADVHILRRIHYKVSHDVCHLDFRRRSDSRMQIESCGAKSGC